MARMPADDERPDEPAGCEGDDYPEIEDGEGTDESDLEQKRRDRQACVEDDARPPQQGCPRQSGSGARHRADRDAFHINSVRADC